MDCYIKNTSNKNMFVTNNYKMGHLFTKLICAFFIALFPCFASGQITVNSTVTATDIVNSFIGSGTSVSNVTMNCNSGSYGTFSNGGSSVIGINNGIMLSTGLISNDIGANTSPNAGNCNDTTFSDPQLLSLESHAIYDPCILEFDFVPHCNSMTISFAFGSDEYPEYVDSLYNDVFGFFVSGPNPSGGSYSNYNIARLPDNTIFGINDINASNNSNYYIDNTGGTDVQFDGITTQISSTLSLSPCGTYHFKIAIADAGDCYYDSGVFIDFTQCSEFSANATVLSAAACACAGSASVSASGGVGPYTYSWAPGGGNAALASGLCAGTYTVTVQDAISCTDPIILTITIPETNTTLTQSQTNINCNGDCTGSATVTASGGIPPYTYAWSNGATTPSASGLCAGTYSVTVADNSGCPDTIYYTITEPAALNIYFLGKYDNCPGECYGAIYSSIATGGTFPYTYLWNNGETSHNIDELCSGNYTITVTDFLGCHKSIDTAIIDLICIPNPPPGPDPCAGSSVYQSSVSIVSNVSCNGGSDGIASVNPSGVAPFSYYWSNGETTMAADNLSAHEYSVWVEDSEGCFSDLLYITLSQPTAITVDSSFTSASCTISDGSATVIPSGGTPSYTYSWSPGGQVTATATGLGAGPNTVTITDANGCIRTSTVNIPIASDGTTVSIDHPFPICHSPNCTDSATAIATGGLAPYTYSWSNASTNSKITGLCDGNYTVTVTDANGCTASDFVIINNPPELTLTQNSTLSTCGLANGTATVVAEGGLPPYFYQWSDGQVTATATSLLPGTYTVSVTDLLGCSKSIVCIVTTEFDGVLTIPTFTNVKCNGDSTGSATAVMTGGFPPHYYSWNTVPEQHTPTITGLAAGKYIITVIERAGCILQDSIIITEPPVLTATITPTNISCYEANDGMAIVNASGGTPPYTYAWDNDSTSQQISNLGVGHISVTVTDSLGCITVVDTTITQPTPLVAGILNTTIMASCHSACDGEATASASGGTSAYTYSWSTTPIQTTATATGLCAGSYTCTVSDAHNCIDTASVTITEPSEVLISPIATDTICPGEIATLTASVSGGNSGGYTFSWDAPGNMAFATTSSVDVSPITTTTYTVNVSDALHGCAAVPVTATVFLNTPLSISATGGASICSGGSVHLNSTAANGTGGPYSFSWSPAATLNDATISNPNASPLTTTTYTVTLTDACMQPVSDTVTVHVFQQAAVSAGTDQAICIGNSAILSATLSGSASSGIWSGGSGIFTPDNTSPNAIYTPTSLEEADGTVVLIFTTNDPVGPCPATSDQITITINQLPSANAGSSQFVCSGSNIALAGSIGGSATSATWTGGNGTYSPNNNALNAIYTPSAAEYASGSVTLTLVTNDPAGPCTSSSSLVTFNFYETPVVEFTADSVAGCPLHCVNFTNLSGIGSGNTITSYHWDFGDGSAGSDSINPSQCFSQTGYYDITLTAVSNNGCTTTLTKTHYVEVYSVPVAAFTAAPNPTNVLDPVITMTNQSSSDVTYWHWDFGDGDTLAPGIPNPTHTYPSDNPSNYTVTLIVHNQHNCYDTATQEVIINPGFIFYMPNSFSPNGDGINDFFFGTGLGIKNYEFWIFDRWGNLIFDCYRNDLRESPPCQWDGIVQAGGADMSGNSGKKAQIDVYVWKVLLTDVFDNPHNYTGIVTLVR